jgi:hypothetical protein
MTVYLSFLAMPLEDYIGADISAGKEPRICSVYNEATERCSKGPPPPNFPCIHRSFDNDDHIITFANDTKLGGCLFTRAWSVLRLRTEETTSRYGG